MQVFRSARIRLTLWYLIILMGVSLFMSTIIYQQVGHEVSRGLRLQRFHERSEQRHFPRRLPADIVADPSVLQNVEQRVLFLLLFINTGVFIVGGSGGYWLAGKTLHPIEKMVRAQQRFIADAAHELRTPITALKLSTEVALRSKRLTVDGARHTLETNKETVERLQILSERLLGLETKGGVEKKPARVTEVLCKSIDIVKPLADKKEIVLKTQFDDTETMTNADNVALEEAITTIIENAVRYTDKGTVTISHHNGTITIVDTGNGIHPKDLPHIFDRFYRADSSRNTEGFGLGLSLAKEIIESHNGKISIQSVLHKGTTAVITLPIIKA